MTPTTTTGGRRCRAAAADVGALKALAEAAPDHLPAVSQVLLARSLYARGASTEAAALLRTARRRHPTDFWVYLDLALGLNDLNHPDPATLNEAESCACMAWGCAPAVPWPISPSAMCCSTRGT